MFTIEGTLSFNTDRLTKGVEYDYVTRTSLNQGVLQTTGFVNKENINPAGTWSLGLLQMDFFYRNKPWYAGQFVRKIVPKITIPNGARLFFQTLLNMQKPALLQVLVRNVDETFRKIKIRLPQTKEKDIDFAFMESFISELEELRLRELEAFLLSTGLNDYQLTPSDHHALNSFTVLQWRDFQIDDLFERVNTKKLTYKAKDLPQLPAKNYTLPCLTSSFMNQGLNYYAPREGATILNNVISIPSNSDVYRAYYQSRDFTVLSDAYAIRWKDHDIKIQSKQYLFLVACINRVTDLPIYSYKNKLGGWNVVKDKYITLPVTADGQPDLSAMEQLVGAVQKMVIADVAKYTAQRLDAAPKNIDNGAIINEMSESIHIYNRFREGYVPLYTLRAACGKFSGEGLCEEEGWVDASGKGFTPNPERYFAVHAKGNSMSPDIKDGDICIFEWYNQVGGTREGDILLAECDGIDDECTIKEYHSVKKYYEDGSWEHERIELIPLNSEYDTIVLEADSKYRPIGILKCVLSQ